MTETETIDTTAILIAISEGAFDGRESELYDAIKIRRATLNQRKKFDIRVGDTVEFNEGARPQYLIGQRATVIRKLQKNLVIQLPGDGVGRFSGGEIRCPIGIVDKVEEEA